MNFEAFLKSFEPFTSIALTAPAGADGDSVGTQCALKEILEHRYPKKIVRIINEEGCPKRYRMVKGAELFEISKDLIAKNETTPDAWICVDGGASRLGDATTQLWSQAKFRAQVDHHALGSEYPYDARLYDPNAAATVEIIYSLIEDQKTPLTQTMAQSLYVGLIFDTGMFKHSNTTPRTLFIAARLLETGFNHTATAERAMLIRTQEGLKILQYVLAHMTVDLGGRFVWSYLPYDYWTSIGADSDDREGIIDQLFLVEGCEVASLVFEKTPGQWKISLRSRGWDVASLAKSLDPQGGGHKLASGCSLNGAQTENTKKVVAAVSKMFETGKRI